MTNKINENRVYLENRILFLSHINTYHSTIFESFVADFKNAVEFFHHAKTGDKTIAGEDEMQAERFANILLSKQYLDGKKIFPQTYTGMQKLAALSELEEMVMEVAV